jgi:serine/threonine-protein kinase
MQVLQAMRFAHDQGIVHRDLKPSNIIVGDHGEVHVVDWGIAKRVGAPEPAVADALPDDSTSTATPRAGALIGTPRYMAPEQARGEAADTRTDVWQLSLLFHELLTLHHYLDGRSTVAEVLDGVLHAPIPHPRELAYPHQPPVPADLAWYVMGGLDRDPARRCRDAGELLERLERRQDGDIPIQCPVTLQLWVLYRAR